MKLGDFLAAPAAVPVSKRSVHFRVIGRHKGDGERVIVEAEAVFAFVSERERAEAYRDADKVLAEMWGVRPVPYDRTTEERNYHFLFRALRDSSPPHATFANTVVELQNALVLVEAQRVFEEYQRFVDEEFPDAITPEEMAGLVEAAKKNYLGALLISSESSLIRRAWPTLLAHFGK